MLSHIPNFFPNAQLDAWSHNKLVSCEMERAWGNMERERGGRVLSKSTWKQLSLKMGRTLREQLSDRVLLTACYILHFHHINPI